MARTRQLSEKKNNQKHQTFNNKDVILRKKFGTDLLAILLWINGVHTLLPLLNALKCEM